MRNIKIIAPSKDFPAAGKRHALRGRLSSRWKTPRAPRETFQPLENAMRSAGDFRKLRKFPAEHVAFSSGWKVSRGARGVFQPLESFPRSA